jgi:hypothetical protein
MNEFIVRDLNASYLAALIDTNAKFYVTAEQRKGGRQVVYRLTLKIYFRSSLSVSIFDWLDGVKVDSEIWGGSDIERLKPDEKREKASGGWGFVRFRNREAAKVMTAVWPYLKSEMRRRQAKECFRFCRTSYGAGPKAIAGGDDKVRIDVMAELKKLTLAS